MVETHHQSMQKEVILHWLRFIFLIIFFMEFILKIIAFRKHYFTDCWNILDFVVIIACILGKFSYGDVTVVCDDVIVSSL